MDEISSLHQRPHVKMLRYKCKDLITKCRVDDFVPILYEQDFLADEQKDFIEMEGITPQEGMRRLLRVVCNYPTQAMYDVLVTCEGFWYKDDCLEDTDCLEDKDFTDNGELIQVEVREEVNAHRQLIQDHDISIEKLQQDVRNLGNASSDRRPAESEIGNQVLEARKMIRDELRDKFRDICRVNPLPEIFSKSFQVSDVFFSLKVQTEEGTGAGEVIECKDLLASSKMSMSDTTIVSACGGSGKTTLLHHIADQFVKDDGGSIEGLQQYDALLYMECRKDKISSFDELLRQHISKTLKQFNIADIQQDMNLLVVVDGFDELNASSAKLLKETLSLPVSMIVTTRPVGLESLVALTSDHNRDRTLLQLLEVDKVAEFVKLYVIQLMKGATNEATNDCIAKIVRWVTHTKIIENVNTPLMLCLITLLYVNTPEDVQSIKSETDLYTKIGELFANRLATELSTEVFKIKEAKKSLQQFMLSYDKLAFEMFICERYELTEDAVDHLKKVYSRQNE